MYITGSVIPPPTTPAPSARPRGTQAERKARSRNALLEAAARGLSRYGYSNLVLEHVAKEAGYTRGALYYQWKDKEELVLDVITWIDEAYKHEVSDPAREQSEPVRELIALARGHAVFCRRDVARVVMALRLEFSNRDHPVARKIDAVTEAGLRRLARLINAARRDGSIPPGPPARMVALAYQGAVEGVTINLAGHAPHDEELTVSAVVGVLGIEPTRVV